LKSAVIVLSGELSITRVGPVLEPELVLVLPALVVVPDELVLDPHALSATASTPTAAMLTMLLCISSLAMLFSLFGCSVNRT
jgi:hypothetical protein